MKKLLAFVLVVTMIAAQFPLTARAESKEGELHEFVTNYIVGEGSQGRLGNEYGEWRDYYYWEHQVAPKSITISDESVIKGELYVVNEGPVEGFTIPPCTYAGADFKVLKPGKADVVMEFYHEVISYSGEAVISEIVTDTWIMHFNYEGEPKPVVYDDRGDDITNNIEPSEYKPERAYIWRFGVEDKEISGLFLDVTTSNPAVATIIGKAHRSEDNGEYMYFAFATAALGTANFDITMSGTDSLGNPWGFQTSKAIVVDLKDNDDHKDNDLPQHLLPLENFMLNQIIKNASLFELLVNIEGGAPFQDILVSEMNYLLRDFSQVDPKVLVMGTGVLALPVIIPAIGGSAIAAILSRVAISIVLCPVDVRILDSDGNLLATVKTGDADFIEVNGLLAWADGDKKYFIVPRDKMSEFQFQLEATDDGTMTFASFCTDSDLNLDSLAVFVDVPLTKGGLFEAELADGSVSRLFALENGERASEIKTDKATGSDNDKGSPAMIIILSILALILISGGIWFVVRKKKR